MAGFSMTERVARGPDLVFRVLADVEAIPEWLPEVTRIEKVGDAPLGRGSRLRETRTVMGKEAQTELQVCEYEPGARYSVKNTTSGVDTYYHYTLVPVGAGTRVELVCDIQA